MYIKYFRIFFALFLLIFTSAFAITQKNIDQVITDSNNNPYTTNYKCTESNIKCTNSIMTYLKTNETEYPIIKGKRKANVYGSEEYYDLPYYYFRCIEQMQKKKASILITRTLEGRWNIYVTPKKRSAKMSDYGPFSTALLYIISNHSNFGNDELKNLEQLLNEGYTYTTGKGYKKRMETWKLDKDNDTYTKKSRLQNLAQKRKR